MRTTTIIVFMLLLFGGYYFGYEVFQDLTTGTSGVYPVGNDSQPFTQFLDYNSTSLQASNDANATVISELMDWDIGGAAMEVLDVTGVENLAKYMIAFINLLTGLLTAPFTFLELTQLAEVFPPAILFAVGALILFMLAIWQIITGRQV